MRTLQRFGFGKASIAAAVGLTSTVSYSVAASAKKHRLAALSAQHSSVPFTEAQTTQAIDALRFNDSSAADQWTALRVLLTTKHLFVALVPAVDEASKKRGEKGLLTFPNGESETPRVLGLFTKSFFHNVEAANKGTKLETSSMAGRQILEAMEALSDPEKSAANPSARVGFLSFNGVSVLATWDESIRAMLLSTLSGIWARETLHKAQTTTEIDLALKEVLSQGSFFFAQIEGADGRLGPAINELAGKPYLLAFVARDLLLRSYGDDTPFASVEGPKLLSAVRAGGLGFDIGIAHDVLEDGKLGFLQLDQGRAIRITNLKK